MAPDYYELLGVQRDAGTQDIKKAYRQLALKYHPDRNPGDVQAEETFKEISNAFGVLNDPEKRKIYDRFGEEGLSGRGHAGFNNVQDIFSSFGDLFSEFFGFGGFGDFGRVQRKGRDLELSLALTFLEAAEGCKKEVNVSRNLRCDSCGGTGAAPGSRPTVCRTCKGKGQVVHSQGFFMISTTCPDCRGAGSSISDPCGDCSGEGVVQSGDELSVTVPAGVEDGQTLRLSGQGDLSFEGGVPGNLYVHLHVEADDRLLREGPHLFAEVPISIPTAALGGKVKVPVLKGDKEIEVKPGTQPGDRLTMHGEGVPYIDRPGRRGDQVIQFRVEVPDKLSSKAKELLRELAEELGEELTERKGLFSRFQRSRNRSQEK